VALNGFLWMCAAGSKRGLHVFYKQFAFGLRAISGKWCILQFSHSNSGLAKCSGRLGETCKCYVGVINIDLGKTLALISI
jgi:hypothetical protein